MSFKVVHPSTIFQHTKFHVPRLLLQVFHWLYFKPYFRF